MIGAAWPCGLRRYLSALLVVYVAKQLVVVLISPPFSGHDEVAHFAGVRIVATQGRIPTLDADTLPADLYQYRPYTIEWRDRERSPLYTAVHPPLYYALMTPLYRAASRAAPETIQYWLRCAAIPFGVVAVIFAALLTRAMYPRDAFLAVTVPSVVAFQPQVSYEAAMVNNDALAIAIYSILLYAIVRTVRDGATIARAALLGLIAGVALLAKGTTIASVVLIPMAVYAGRQRSWRDVVTKTLVAYAVAAAIAGPWWWFMVRTYGDPMAFSALAATQPDLLRTEGTFLQLLFSGRFLVERWIETWGEFGWRLIHVSPALLFTLALGSAGCLVGLARHLAADGAIDPQEDWQRRALVLLAAACVLAYLGAVQFGVRFLLTQARYFFPSVNAAALLLMVGLRTWIPPTRRTAAQVAVLFTAVALNVTIYSADVVPYWYFR